jgi:hypothetical protein
MWLIGQVVDVELGCTGHKELDSPDFTTISLEANFQVIPVVCFTGHVPDDILGKCVRIDVDLYEVRFVREHPVRFAVLYRADNYPGTIELLKPSAVRALGLSYRTLVC